MRIDKVLVEYKFFSTRNKAQHAIKEGIVSYQGKVVQKANTEITDISQVKITGEKMPYVSRGGLKLEKALTAFQIDLTNQIVLDIGSSTGGFSDCALQHGARHIIAIDTGTNQMDTGLRKDPRISLFEQTDFRTISIDKIKTAQVAMIDISFLSISKILDRLASLEALNTIICLIKPQFECGKTIADKYKGVIRDAPTHVQILTSLITLLHSKQFFVHGLTFSPITGSSGNIEYLAYLTRIPCPVPPIEQTVHTAFKYFESRF